MKRGCDSLGKAVVGIQLVLQSEEQAERSEPDGDGGQFPAPEGSVNHRHASFLPKQDKLALGRQTDLLCLHLEPCLLNPKASRNPEAT